MTQKSIDGGYDIEVQKNKERALVQCKHYGESTIIGVQIVRELGGVMLQKRVFKGYIVCLDGPITQYAKECARETNIEFITLEVLTGEIHHVKGGFVIHEDKERKPHKKRKHYNPYQNKWYWA